MWRFFGFVLLVLLGLAAVFYYTGMNEDPGARGGRRQDREPKKITAPLAGGKPAPVAPASTADRGQGPLRFTGSITIYPAELRAKEEMELASEVEMAEIVEVLKDVGDQVKPDEVLVKLKDDRIKLTFEAQKLQAGKIADEKIKAAKNALQVYQKNLKRLESLLKDGASTPQEVELERARVVQAETEIAKTEQEKIFEEHRRDELQQQMNLYQLKARIPGTIVRVLKKRGNTLRQGETAMYIVNDKSLVADGAVESGLAGMLSPGMTVVLEPENDRESNFMFDGHTGPVTGLALAPQLRFVASSSEDGSVILWSLQPLSRLPWLRLDRPDHRRIGCRAVAINPVVANDTYQLLAGYADGSLLLWNVKLTSSGPKIDVRDLGKDHDQAVNCVAFRADGKYAATGGDDRRVAVWDLSSGRRLYWVHPDSTDMGNAHYGAVTTILFTKDMQHLLTTGTDNAVRRWKLGVSGSELERTLHGRTGDVGKVNLADDGRHLFFENNEELRIVDSKTLEPRSVINSRRSGRFVQFAHISPDGRLAVAATDQGRNMVMRLPKLADAVEVAQPTPSPSSGATPVGTSPNLSTASSQTTPELWRQEGAIAAHFTLPEAVRATCAEFLSDAQKTYVLMGSTDNKIRIWELPGEAEMNTPILARLKFVSTQVESGTGLVRVQAEFENTRQLKTGKRVAMIVYPDASDHVKEPAHPATPPAATTPAPQKVPQ